ncbi:MAG: polyketide synthase, partial [Humidesulfovibrio sp.]|nr:polyketide synthase [Humidesulfovibrio sp.]
AVSATTPVAIIGADCRLPGAPDLDAYWRLLVEGREGLGPLPLERYGADYAARMAAAPFPQRGGFLEDVARFDADFFALSPVEALRLDPQHRLFLETAWGALESAGLRPADLPRETGVFAGVSGMDYAELLRAHGIEADAHTATGNSHAMLTNRLSFLLDLHGPSEAIDTACSSSLVAVTRAVEAIRSGRCLAAFAGGVNLALSLESFLGPHQAGMLSPEGRCKTFDCEADGYVRGEGAGVVLLKPLEAALRDGDPVLGVIAGAAENHGGRAGSLTAPNTLAQAEVIVRAMAGIDPATVACVEAHGTGTRLGDPVEVEALKLAYSRLTETAHPPLPPGSVAL